jgi:hypothetical protein
VRVSWLSLKTKVVGFFGLGLKTGSSDLVICASKSSRRFLSLCLKTKWTTVCQLHHKTNERRLAMGHALRSSVLLHVEASQTRVSQFVSKLAEARWRVVHVASSWRSRGVKAEDGCVDVTGCVRPFYPKIVVFIVLGP